MSKRVTFWKQQDGYSLISLAIGLIILGAISAMLIAAYSAWHKRETINTTENHIELIKKAVDAYVTEYGVLPCVASLTIAADDAAFGVSSDCSAAPAAGTFSGGANLVRIGAVPVRDLNLPDEYIADGWGNRFVFAVTTSMAKTPVDYRSNTGAIEIEDTQNRSVIEPPGSGLYVILSHGESGFGAYDKASGALVSACLATSQEGENCDHSDITFRNTLLYTDKSGADFFDDIVAYQTKDFINTPVVNRYILRTLPCDEGGITFSATPDDCSTRRLEGADRIYINPASGDARSDGELIFNETFTSKTDGELMVRANIPASYQHDSNDCSCSSNPILSNYSATCSEDGAGGRKSWDESVMIAIYIDGGTYANESILLNPACTITTGDSSGGAHSMVLANKGGIVDGVDYEVEIYAYSLGNKGIDSNNLMWIGTKNFGTHQAVGIIEILEISDH